MLVDAGCGFLRRSKGSQVGDRKSNEDDEDQVELVPETVHS